MKIELDRAEKFKELEGHKLSGHIEKRDGKYWFVVDNISD
jgi:hypothetical protein